MKTKLKLLIFYSLTPLAIFFAVITGCGDDEITSGPPIVDTTALIFNDLVISERIPPFETSKSSADLYHGVILLDSSSVKDVVLVDSAGLSENFYLRSGDLSFLDIPPGFQTRFKDVYTHVTQEQFDTITVIPDSDSILTPEDFTENETSSFRVPLPSKRVVGFYLAGRYSTYTAQRVYGMLYLDFAYEESSVFKLRFDVKINKNGENRFAKTTSITY